MRRRSSISNGTEGLALKEGGKDAIRLGNECGTEADFSTALPAKCTSSFGRNDGSHLNEREGVLTSVGQRFFFFGELLLVFGFEGSWSRSPTMWRRMKLV